MVFGQKDLASSDFAVQLPRVAPGKLRLPAPGPQLSLLKGGEG